MKIKIYCLLLLMFSVTLTMSQSKTVTGTVMSDAGEPLSGVTVILKGTKTATATNAGNAALSNCYLTSDCVFSANPITGGNAYSGTAPDLFTDPANGNFTIKDNSFAGKSSAGDPRWR